MHILFDKSEKKAVTALTFPDGTTLVESEEGEYGDECIFAYKVVDGKLTVTTDFKEQERDWKKGEEKKFSKDITKWDIFNFFLRPGEDVPQREYSTMCNLEHKHFSYISHSGSYHYETEDQPAYYIFRVKINKDSDLDAAETEIEEALQRIDAEHPTREKLELDIFEDTLSEYGVYGAYWDRKEFVITKVTYGRKEEIARFDTLRQFIEYIAKNLYYQEVTRV
jgi:hypothetical protein